MRCALLLLLAGLLTACGPQGQGEGDRTPPAARQGAAPAPAAGVNPLERAALAAGVVADGQELSPVGLYRQRHEAGRDSLCILPPPKGKEDEPMRFGLEASFGENIECHGQGDAKPSGDKLILNFSRSACLIVARYEGDRILLPGTLDSACRKLCSERGSLEGVSFPRVSREASVAAAAEARGGGALCPAA